MLELKALLLTQGMHGMISQVEGMAKALGLNFRHEKIKLKSLTVLTFLMRGPSLFSTA